MNSFSGKQRESVLQASEHERYDVIIIGGGITGAGIALDATTRGLKTALFEMQDFAAGTSSRSTKLIHGGLRYLKQFEIKLVADVGKERAIVYENGPHVTTPEWMLLPIYKGGTFGKFSTSIGLRLYDFLAGVKRYERRKMLNRKETLNKAPLLKKEGLLGGGYYVEYRTDDARLTIEVVKKAVEQGAQAVNYTKVESLLYEDEKVSGVVVKDLVTGKEYKVLAKRVINATGPWVDQIREIDGSKENKTLKLTKGVHIVIDQKKFPLKQAIYYDTKDGRMVFAIPREGKTYVGTTDTFYQDDLASPTVTKEDCDYLITTIHDMFPKVKLTLVDIESSWAGLRPLIHEDGKNPSEISRKDEIWQSKSGLITIAGGKLTGFRKMAEQVVDTMIESLDKEQDMPLGTCKTKNLPISGGDVGGSKDYKQFLAKKTRQLLKYDLDKMTADKLVRLYGSNIDRIIDYMKEDDSNAPKTDLPLYVQAMLLYSLEHEMTLNPLDFFVRRTGSLYFDINWVLTFKKQVTSYIASYYRWSNQTKSCYENSLDQVLGESRIAPLDRTIIKIR
nr:glycerol-3-phosphate dehydrogenase/oxidase [Litchfieldia alkalitelluris]